MNGGNRPFECLNVLLKQTRILQDNQENSRPNLHNSFLRFSNVLHGTDFSLHLPHELLMSLKNYINTNLVPNV